MKARVLIFEDNDFLRSMLKNILKELNFEINTFSNPGICSRFYSTKKTLPAPKCGGIMPMLKYIAAAIVITGMIACGRNEPLAKYNPKSQQEQALKSVLLDFQDGANRKDAKKVAHLIHENASVMIGRDRRILSKAEYIKILPKRLADNPSISLGRPKMKISGETAEVKIYMTRGAYNGLITYIMKFDNNKWYIQSWRY